LIGAEVDVWDARPDPSIYGGVDLIELDGPSYKITDWKTGKITDETGSVKLLYQVQVMLYAALAQTKSGIIGGGLTFPASGFLENPATRERHEVILDQSECMSLLSDGQTLVQDVNSEVAANPSSANLVTNLAVADIDGCRWCPFRPACPAYLSELPNWMDDDEEVYDVIGTFVEMAPENQLISRGAIVVEDSSGNLWRVALVDLDASRHDNPSTAPFSPQPGDCIGIFNVFRNQKDGLIKGYTHMMANKQTHIIYTD